MSADSFHAVVEGKMRRREVLDWSDFLTLVRTCLDRPVHPPEVLSMTHDQFFEIDTKKLLKPNYSVSSKLLLSSLNLLGLIVACSDAIVFFTLFHGLVAFYLTEVSTNATRECFCGAGSTWRP